VPKTKKRVLKRGNGACTNSKEITKNRKNEDKKQKGKKERKKERGKQKERKEETTQESYLP